MEMTEMEGEKNRPEIERLEKERDELWEVWAKTYNRKERNRLSSKRSALKRKIFALTYGNIPTNRQVTLVDSTIDWLCEELGDNDARELYTEETEDCCGNKVKVLNLNKLALLLTSETAKQIIGGEKKMLAAEEAVNECKYMKEHNCGWNEWEEHIRANRQELYDMILDILTR